MKYWGYSNWLQFDILFFIELQNVTMPVTEWVSYAQPWKVLLISKEKEALA